MKGYTGKILRVDLTKSKIRVEPTKAEWIKMFLGGKGLAARYLLEEMKPNVDPLSLENVLIFMTGPLTGTKAPSFSKCGVISKSPATNTFCDSYFGGYFPAEMKFAGFDGIIIKGRAERLSYLSVVDGEAQIEVIADLKNKGTYETADFVKETSGLEDPKIVTIGPAGENLVKFACICSDVHHQAGRGGMGTVMASKNLKAIAIQGEKKVKLYDPDGFSQYIREILEDAAGNPFVKRISRQGTPYLVDEINDLGILPTSNFQEGIFEKAKEVNWDAMREKTLIKKAGCYGCPLACRNVNKIKSGRFKGLTIEGPEYETLALVGSNCGVGDLEAILKFNDLCDNYGLDTISTGNVVGFAMECYERGFITKEETGGLELSFGSIDSFIEMPGLITHRQGIGSVLADGLKVAAERIGKGSGRFAMHCKGLEYPGYDPRGAIGMALAYATSDRGACHMRGYLVFTPGPFQPEGKAAILIREQNRKSVTNSLIRCSLSGIAAEAEARLFTLATGIRINEKDIQLIGERIWNMVRVFNVGEGFSRKDDTIPMRLVKEHFSKGPAAHRVVSLDAFNFMLDVYYKLRGWSKEGIPTRNKLQELGIGHLSARMLG